MTKPFKKTTRQFLIPKQDKRIPDGWGIEVKYLDGSPDDTFEGVHRFFVLEGGRWLEITTTDDEVVLISQDVIKRVKCDNRFIAAVEIKRELERKAAAGAAPKPPGAQ